MVVFPRRISSITKLLAIIATQEESRMFCARRHFISLLAAFSIGALSLNAHAAGAPRVSLKTSMGEIVLELDQKKAPKTVENFLKYVKKGQYNGTIFHRVMSNFMIQGGGFDAEMNEKPTSGNVENEAKNGLKNETYTIAMARRSDPHSASAQFFINVKDNDMLDYPGQDGWGYAVFGKVIKGSDVVEKIKAVPVGNRGQHQNVPLTPVVIESAKVLK
jgi:cyclophilin family peptidyl-prolyl cis-trans isomerase